MGLAFIHNPDWLSVEALSLVWTLVEGDVEIVATGAGGGYLDTAHYRSTTGVGLLKKGVRLGDPVRFAMGCRFRCVAGPPVDEPRLIIGVVDPSGNVQCCVGIDNNQELGVYLGDMEEGPVSGVTSAAGVSTEDGWIRLGFQGVLSPTFGDVEIVRNGSPVVQLSGVPTMHTTLYGQGGLVVGVAPEGAVSHIYVSDVSTPGYAPLLHDLFVHVARPTSEGYYPEFTPVGAATVAAAIDDVTPDGDATYASTSALGFKRLSTVMTPDLPDDTPRVYAVQVSAVARTLEKSDNDTSAGPLVVVDGDVTTDPWHALTASYAVVRGIWDYTPGWHHAWRVGEVNALEAGIRMPFDTGTSDSTRHG